MAKSPSFQFYVRDWLCSLKVQRMTGDQVKAYMYLLCSSWLENPRASLPDNDEELAAMARVPIDHWKKIKAGVMKGFHLEGDRWHNERLTEVSSIQESHADRGRRGGEASSGNSGRKIAKPIAKEIAKQIAGEYLSSSTSSSYSNVISIKYNEWVDFRFSKGKGISKMAVEKQLKFLLEKPEDACQMIDQSMMNDWQGLFPLKGKSNATTQTVNSFQGNSIPVPPGPKLYRNPDEV